ncbi:MAG: protein kinase [Candidatus Zixiibacteriota bacterium]
MIGQSIKHYTITGKLGAGGMGEVYLASDAKLDRQVALKFLPSSLWNETEAQQRLIREAKAASKLDHPNIVTIYGIEEHEGRPFIVMAHVRGVTLKEYCTSQKRSLGELIDLAVQMAEGLQSAHEAGVVHRDLKPGNILVDDRGRVRVLDFGIARLRGAAKLTQTGSTVGTLAYSAPELAQGKEAEATADIYSLGVVLYQMLSGQLPFDADHEAALLYSILNEAPRPLSDHTGDIPPGIQKLVGRCLEKDPKKRFASCGELAAELRRNRPGAAVASDAGHRAKPSIAVLPFANMSADPENEYFSDGLAEELLNVLARNPDLKVTGRTSSFAFKGKHEDLRSIGEKLGVETLLEGSVRKAGNRVRITTQLVKTSDGFHLWSETYDRVLDDIFAVQDDIAKSVANAMNVTLLGKQKRVPQGNSDSYNLVLKARFFGDRINGESLAKSRALYEEALRINPNDARAWAGLSLTVGTQAGYGFEDVELGAKIAIDAGEKARDLDDTLPAAHLTLGWMYMAFRFAWEKAGASFRRAYELAPGDGMVVTGVANYEACCGDIREAVRLSERSLEMDPLNPSAHLYAGRVFWWSGDTARARETYRKALELSPGFTSAHAGISMTLYEEGRIENALQEALQEAPSGYRDTAMAIVYHALGNSTESMKALESLKGRGEQWAFQIAGVHANRGEADQAFFWLERAYELHDAGIQGTGRIHLLRNLHSDPRWPVFLTKIGLLK